MTRSSLRFSAVFRSAPSRRRPALRPRPSLPAVAAATVFLALTLLVSGPRLAAQPAATVVDSQAFLESVALPANAPDSEREGAPNPYADAVADLLSRMTLREKVGQMTQLELSMISRGRDADIRVDPAKLRKAVVEYGVGSILNVYQETLPVERWHEILRQVQAAAGESRLGIPVLYGIDSIHGANYVTGATLFPQPLAMAATWNPELMLEASRVTAAETRAAGIPWNFSPVLDVGRQPLWPRLYETFGEDVYLAEVMGVASVRGYQGDDPAAPRRVAACLKHYAGYSFPFSGHDRTPALIPEVLMREIFLPPFAAAVRAGALSVMVNSGEVNGVPGHVNRWLLTDVLRGEMGFRGVAVSDWEDIKKLVGIHRVAADEKEATRLAVMAGIDMSMVPSDYSFADLLTELVEEGAVPVERIDEAVGRVLRMKMELGLFEHPLGGIGNGVEVGSAASWELSLEAARQSMTLLVNRPPSAAGGSSGEKEDGEKEAAAPLLPLAAGTRLLVTGPTCDSRAALNNGWSLVWQGDREDLYPTDRPTVLGALRDAFGDDAVTWVPGAGYDAEMDVAAAASAAAEADVAVVCLGEIAYAETPGNIDDLALPAAQLHLARAVAAAGKPVVLVLVEGRPRLLGDAADAASAILMAYNPGPEGGRAVADVLLGRVDPGGRLPFTYPRHPNALRTYDHKAFEDQDTSFGFTAFRPQFEFGSGLSYTRFETTDLAVSPSELAADGEVEVAVTVRNVGERRGFEVVQLYLSDEVASITPPVRRLRRFAKLDLAPGESRRVVFRLGGDDLSFIGADGAPRIEPGRFAVSVGGLTGGFEIRAAQAAGDQ